ncbi:uncharacterized protein LOC125825125 [Solanum verrucosum]|uniref:uncharacterized protein LOC125825125 n=1 Tax=Solanum verrucosum TaxID=315347 RepID=UPI0020D013FB|nr:uncharacterized protein LOC125825125 [Solanum verrucosum]
MRKSKREGYGKSEDKQNNQEKKNNQQQQEEKEQMQSNKQIKKREATDNNNTQKEEQWQTQTRRKNKNHTQNHDQGKTIHLQEQAQQTKANHAQQQMQESGMKLKFSDTKQVESNAQTPPSPTPVIVVDDHCVENETPSPEIPFVVTEKVNGGRMVVKEKHTNMQKGEPKGRELSHVIHENPLIDHMSDLQTPATTKSSAHQTK